MKIAVFCLCCVVALLIHLMYSNYNVHYSIQPPTSIKSIISSGKPHLTYPIQTQCYLNKFQTKVVFNELGWHLLRLDALRLTNHWQNPTPRQYTECQIKGVLPYIFGLNTWITYNEVHLSFHSECSLCIWCNIIILLGLEFEEDFRVLMIRS